MVRRSFAVRPSNKPPFRQTGKQNQRTARKTTRGLLAFGTWNSSHEHTDYEYVELTPIECSTTERLRWR